MFTGLLPIGTVVLLKESTKRIMIIGVVQKQLLESDKEVIWDYSACLYPEGFVGANKLFLFNNDQIDKIFATGYQDEEQFAFKITADRAIGKIREINGEEKKAEKSSEE